MFAMAECGNKGIFGGGGLETDGSLHRGVLHLILGMNLMDDVVLICMKTLLLINEEIFQSLAGSLASNLQKPSFASTGIPTPHRRQNT